jgi:hypothetical protein
MQCETEQQTGYRLNGGSASEKITSELDGGLLNCSLLIPSHAESLRLITSASRDSLSPFDLPQGQHQCIYRLRYDMAINYHTCNCLKSSYAPYKE